MPNDITRNPAELNFNVQEQGLPATQAVSGINPGVRMPQDPTDFWAGIANTIPGMYKLVNQAVAQRQDKAYLDGVTDKLQGQENAGDYSILTRGAYQQGVGASSATLAATQLQYDLVNQFNTALDAGETPSDFLTNRIQPAYNKILDNTKDGTWTLNDKDRAKAIDGITTHMQAILPAYAKSFDARTIEQAHTTLNSDVSAGARDAVLNYSDPAQLKKVTADTLNRIVSGNPLINTKDKSKAVVDYFKSVVDMGMAGGDTSVIQFKVLQDAIMNDPNVARLAPDQQADLYGQLQTARKSAAATQMSKADIRLSEMHFGVEQGMTLDHSQIQQYLQDVGTMYMQGDITPEKYSAFVSSTYSLKEAELRKQEEIRKQQQEGIYFTEDQAMQTLQKGAKQLMQSNPNLPGETALLQVALPMVNSTFAGSDVAMQGAVRKVIQGNIQGLMQDPNLLEKGTDGKPVMSQHNVNLVTMLRTAYADKGATGKMFTQLTAGMDQTKLGVLNAALAEDATTDRMNPITLQALLFKHSQMQTNGQRAYTTRDLPQDLYQKAIQQTQSDMPGLMDAIRHSVDVTRRSVPFMDDPTLPKVGLLTTPTNYIANKTQALLGISNPAVEADKAVQVQVQSAAMRAADAKVLSVLEHQGIALNSTPDQLAALRKDGIQQAQVITKYGAVFFDQDAAKQFPHVATMDATMRRDFVEKLVSDTLEKYPGQRVQGIALQPDKSLFRVKIYTDQGGATPINSAMYDDNTAEVYTRTRGMSHQAEQQSSAVVIRRAVADKLPDGTVVSSQVAIPGTNPYGISGGEWASLLNNRIGTEGFRSTPYKDTQGHATVGFGFMDTNNSSQFGTRSDGSLKGTGYLGVLPMQDGSGRIASEISVGISIDGKEVTVPTLVPTLSETEKKHLLSGGSPTPAIISKAADFARSRISQGKSVWAGPGESPGASMYDQFMALPKEQRTADNAVKIMAGPSGLPLYYKQVTIPAMRQMGMDPNSVAPEARATRELLTMAAYHGWAQNANVFASIVKQARNENWDAWRDQSKFIQAVSKTPGWRVGSAQTRQRYLDYTISAATGQMYGSALQ